MITRFPIRALSLLVLLLVVAGCEVSNNRPATATSSDPEQNLRIMSRAMQKSILEGAAAGAFVGPGFIVIYGRDGRSSDDLRQASQAGAAAGAAAGAYVGWVQDRYASREDRLEQVKTDLDRNAQEMQTTISVMRDVLALQTAQLARLRASAASGTADQNALASEVAEARGNLAQMQAAINGAQRRQAELQATRGLVLIGGSTSEIDPELQALSNQIVAMNSIAADLSENL